MLVIDMVVGVSTDASAGVKFGFGVVLADVNVNILEALSRATPAPIERLPVEEFSC